jgi:hypothetical protein
MLLLFRILWRRHLRHHCASSALSSSAIAGNSIPECMDNRGTVLPLDNDQVVNLKKTAKLGQSIRAHAGGKVTRLFPDRNGHAHFEISMDGTAENVLEVVYSEDFGEMPQPPIGAYVDTCGDFINAYATQNGYPPSPSKAIIHWVHRSNNERKHPSGYVVLDNVLYGYGADRKARN